MKGRSYTTKPLAYFYLSELIKKKQFAMTDPVLESHSSVKQCTICEEKFADKRKLDKHMFYVHKETVHLCNLCGKSAKQKSVIKNHIEAKHVSTTGLYCQLCPKL